VSAEERFTEIFQTFHVRVTAYARRRIPAGAVDDVVAAAFLAAWRHLESLPPDPLPWLYRAAALEIAAQSRKDRQRRRLAQRVRGTADPSEADHADRVATADRWRVAFMKLGEGDREVLRLAAWEQLTPREGATVLGCSPTAYKVRLHRARRRLEGLIDEPSTSRAPNGQPPREDAARRGHLDCSPFIEPSLARWPNAASQTEA
jgi:RNA polymerase sigma-70 factor, ECF subfamily